MITNEVQVVVSSSDDGVSGRWSFVRSLDVVVLDGARYDDGVMKRNADAAVVVKLI